MTTPLGPRPPSARRRPWSWSRNDCGIALDLGSARTRAWLSGRRTIIDVPTMTFQGAASVCPIQRGCIVDTPGTARMLGHRLPRFGRPVIILITPVLGGVAYRTEARTAVEILRPRTVLTVPTARAAAVSVDADLIRPLLVVDLGAHLTEVTLLADGAVVDARHIALGIIDLDRLTPAAQIADAVVTMVTTMPEEDPGSLVSDALRRGALLVGGGALRPDITYRLARRLDTPVRPVPAPHTAAVRGAAKLLQAVHTHPFTAAVSDVTHMRPGPV